jgi:hypothetical protein
LVGPPHPPDALAALHFRDAVLKIGSVMAELAPKPKPKRDDRRRKRG